MQCLSLQLTHMHYEFGMEIIDFAVEKRWFNEQLARLHDAFERENSDSATEQFCYSEPLSYLHCVFRIEISDFTTGQWLFLRYKCDSTVDHRIERKISSA